MRARFTDKAEQALLAVEKLRGQEFERGLVLQFAVFCEVDFAHPAFAEKRKDLITPDGLADELRTLRRGEDFRS